jgi:hypothetical protein
MFSDNFKLGYSPFSIDIRPLLLTQSDVGNASCTAHALILQAQGGKTSPYGVCG